tara:strand:- start:50 stop:472 length:423 start_codon:yes stop_codon:yes gene_type:complete
MFKNIFKKKEKENSNDKDVIVASLLVHAAKMDQNYTDKEKKIITRAIIDLNNINPNQAEKLLKHAEEKEDASNQIVEFTREIKKYSMEYRLKIIEVIWKIVYSDGISDSYESTLVRRICGLLYISDKDSGIIKTKVQNLK